MKLHLTLFLLLSLSLAHADLILTSWFTQNSGTLARVIQSSSTTTPVSNRNIIPTTTWPTTGITNNNTGGAAQTTAVYADVQRIRYDTSYVYINSSGLASYTMGPFLNSGTGLFGFWPLNQGYTCRITRNPGTPPAAKARHGGGLIGMMVNGVGIYDLGDAFGFVQTASAPVTGSDSMGQTNATHPWWRDALAVEVVTFDPGFGHQPGLNGQYHYHAEPKALRYQLGDNMQATYSSTNNTYSYTESPAAKHHSPILGWCFDGYPIYGPYGCSDPNNAASAITRMRSGFVLRNAVNSTTYGVTNIVTISGTTTLRTMLPRWAAIAEGLATLANYSTQTLNNGDFVLSTATLYGPATNYVNGATTYSLGRYIGDYDFLGDRGQTQGPSGAYDLDQYNGRFCKTPEFPDGTYAYFCTVDAASNPSFPYMLGKEYYGTRDGTAQAVTVPTTGVTEIFNSTNTVPSWSSGPAVNTTTGDVTLTWNSVEGGTYKVEVSNNLTTWTTLNANVSAPVNTVLPQPNNVITTTMITETGAALPVNNTRRFYKVSRNP